MDIIDHRATFLDQYEALRTFPMFLKMERTVEGSPWHREANVLVHTDMVVNEYVKAADRDCEILDRPWDRDDYLGAMSCAFHDTGKPDSEIEKWSEARGKYRAYHGHELLSARIFETYATQRYPMFTAVEITMVSWMIEHHMPWSLEDKGKLDNMALTAKAYNLDVFLRALLADQFGRIADDQKTKNQKAVEWTTMFRERATKVTDTTFDHRKPTLIMPIAPSGAGKSTYLNRIKLDTVLATGKEIEVFSLDALRHEFYDADDYATAFQGSIDDKSFEARANARFHADIKRCKETGTDLYVDNTNLSAKRRRWYLDIAKRHGFNTEAVLMPVDLDTIIKRQKTRGDKTVPVEAVKRQFYSLQAPMVGEFDRVIVSEHNLVK